MSDRKLPMPIKPRTLIRRKNPIFGYDYVTSDGRYEATAQYADNRGGGYTARISRYRVVDKRTGEVMYWERLDDVRWLYCTPIAEMPWIVHDVDDGVLRVEPTRKAAVAWASSLAEATRVGNRHQYGTGRYEYVFTDSDGDICGNYGIIRADVAHLAGIDAVQQPLYPFPDEPFEMVDRPAPKTKEAV